MAQRGRNKRQKKSGFGFWGPFPSYQRRTRRGGSVKVTGCCLPLALGMLGSVAGAGALAVSLVT